MRFSASNGSSTGLATDIEGAACQSANEFMPEHPNMGLSDSKPDIARLPRGDLLRVFGMAFALSIGVGDTIGGGILHTPGEIAALLPVAWLFMAMWALGALNAFLGGTVYAELGAMYPEAGGTYVYARRALGDYAGFFVGYTFWVQLCAVQAALALLIGEYAPVLVPALTGHSLAVAAVVLAILVTLQWHRVHWAGYVQTLTTLAKVLAFVGLIVAAFVLPHAIAAASLPEPVAPRGIALVLALVLAMRGIIFTYNGYYFVVTFGEELRDPGRDIPRAIFRGLLVITAIYLLLNLAFVWVLPMARMAHAPFVGGVLAEALFGERGNIIITAIVVVSLLGTVNAQMLSAPRMLLAMGRRGLFAPQATYVNRGGTPSVALALSTVVAGAFLFSRTFAAVLAVVTLFMVVQYLLMYVSIIALRRREPQAPRPYRAWGYPWTTLAAVLIAVAFLIGIALGDPRHSLIAFIILILSYPVYRGVLWLRQKRTA